MKAIKVIKGAGRKPTAERPYFVNYTGHTQVTDPVSTMLDTHNH